MILQTDDGRWYIDVRNTETSEQVSFDLTHHLPRRISAGRVIVVTDNTKVFLSVIRKRWMRLLYEVECQRSSTLDKTKKEALQYEADQMRTCRFATKPPTEIPNAHVYFLHPSQLTSALPDYMTLYVTVLLPITTLTEITASLKPHGLLVVYGTWPREYDPLLRSAASR